MDQNPRPAPAKTQASTPSNLDAETLRGQRLHIPDLGPAFASWKQGVNPLRARVRQAVDARLGELLSGGGGEERVLEKLRAADIGLFAAGWFPDAPYAILETAAFYCVWLFLWDDAIDGAEGREEGGLDAEAYCRQSIAFVEHALGCADGSPVAPPTKICGSFADVGRRVGEFCGLEERRELAGHLRRYMEACVTEYRARLAGTVPSVDEFYAWRLGTSSVDAMLHLSRTLNGITLPREILGSKELAAMGFSVNKLLILINELFSLKKELKDGAFGNLIPITMRALGTDLEDAVHRATQDISQCIREYDRNASAIRALVAEQNPKFVDNLNKLIDAYQAIATTVLNFSVHSPRYGLLKDRQPDGSFAVEL